MQAGIRASFDATLPEEFGDAHYPGSFGVNGANILTFKEILDLLHRGVHVWGASSMGALRAAELAPFGMRGFGRVFESYVQGEIEGDDEVAVLHAPEEMGYAVLTKSLVNVKYICASMPCVIPH